MRSGSPLSSVPCSGRLRPRTPTWMPRRGFRQRCRPCRRDLPRRGASPLNRDASRGGVPRQQLSVPTRGARRRVGRVRVRDGDAAVDDELEVRGAVCRRGLGRVGLQAVDEEHDDGSLRVRGDRSRVAAPARARGAVGACLAAARARGGARCSGRAARARGAARSLGSRRLRCRRRRRPPRRARAPGAWRRGRRALAAPVAQRGLAKTATRPRANK